MTSIIIIMSLVSIAIFLLIAFLMFRYFSKQSNLLFKEVMRKNGISPKADSFVCKTDMKKNSEACCKSPCTIYANGAEFNPDTCPFDGTKQRFEKE